MNFKVDHVKVEYQTEPLGIDVRKPRFSWQLSSDRKDVVQSSYLIRVSDEKQDVWESGMLFSDQSHLVEYQGIALEPGTRYFVFISVTNNYGETAESETFFETGLMSADHMSAQWITHGYEDNVEACPVYLHEFEPRGQVKSARIYASALGVYELSVNGIKVGDRFFAPGWTSYKTRVQYQTYDISNLLGAKNCIEITSANGWYSGVFGFDGSANHYGTRTAVWAQMEVTYENGEKELLVTDETWQYGTGIHRYAEIYHGEVIDHNYDIVSEGMAVTCNHSVSILTAQESEPVRITKRLKAVKRIISPKGEQIYDFGQNLTGIVETRLNCPKGTAVTLQHAEVLDKEGNFYTENIRSARATDTFITRGGQDEIFLPAFTFHGFRYIKVEGADLDIDCVTACVLHTDMEDTGDFSCSMEAVNRLWFNIQWGQRSNFLDIPTDCPQRDERLGWTGDAQVFASTASFNFNTALFFTKWLRDLKAEQTLEHGVPHIIPNILSNIEGAAAWSDAATIIPWTVYEAYGDIRLLSDQYDSMKNWVEYIRSQAGAANLWQSGFQYGDWVALDKEESSDRVGATDIYLIATAYYAYSCSLLAKAAQTLGKEDDAKIYCELYREIVTAFQREYITETGRMVSETQTGCILALHFELCKEEHRGRILESIIQNLKKHNNHLTTGFVGTPYLCHALSDHDEHELAGTVFLKQDYPSWLYCVNMGATTIWERWNSMKPDGSFDESGMNSFNHYAYGAIGSWMFSKLGGLNIMEPGYKKVRVAPRPIKGITSVNTRLKTVYGELVCHWECQDGVFQADITIPCNTSAVISLPGLEEVMTGSGNYHFEYATDLKLDYERYSMDSTLGELMENPESLRVLREYAPAMLDNPMIQFAANQSIAQLTSMMQAGGAQLFEMAIAAANAMEHIKTNIKY